MTRTAISGYRTYSFVDKDPIIDVIRSAIQRSGLTYSEVSKRSDVAASTIYNWLHKDVRRPQNASSTAVINALETDTHTFEKVVVMKHKLTGKLTIFRGESKKRIGKRITQSRKRTIKRARAPHSSAIGKVAAARG